MRARKILFALCSLALVPIFVLGISFRDDKNAKPSGISLEERAAKAYQYARHHGLNTDYALFLDYSIPSGTCKW